MYRVNGKNLAVTRLFERGKTADRRIKFMHVGAKGSTVLTPHIVARVSLPTDGVGGEALIYPASVLPRVPVEDTTVRTLEGGLPAVSTPKHLVARMDDHIPRAKHGQPTFTCDGELLRQLLTVACEVNGDSNHTLRLRICDGGSTLRIDNYRQPGTQEFVGVLRATLYAGNYIPDDNLILPSEEEPKPKQTAFVLKAREGRRFRGAKE